MVDFREVVPSTTKVKLDSIDGEFSVTGINLEGLATILLDNPEVAQVFDGKGFDHDNAGEIAKLGSKFVSEAIAAGFGYPGDEKAIEVAKGLPPGDALTAIEAIAAKSFPRGLADFLGKLNKAGASIIQNEPTVSASPTPKSKTKVTATKSVSSKPLPKVASS